MKKCGLFTDKGKPVPLKEVAIDVKVSGFIAHVQADLHYENTEDEACEAKFTFPLDDGSAVYKFEAVIEGRHIVAECQEKEEARQTYDDAIASGQTAMLLEEDDNSSDVFCCTVGNLPAKTVAKLTLAYVLELPAEDDGKLRFTLPVVLNPRYSPNLGHLVEAKGTTRVSISDIPYTFKFSAAVTGKQPVKSVTSDQGNVAMDVSDDKMSAKVTLGEDFKFDDDVRFLIEYEDIYKVQCVMEAGDKDATGFLGEDVLMVNFYPDIDVKGQTNCGEYIFVLDRSGSMGFGSNKIGNAKEALLLFLKSLPVGCYFNIVSFGSSFKLLFPDGSKEYTKASLEEAVNAQSKMNADMGGTEILQPMKHIYAKDLIPGHPRQLFLLTDGKVSNVKDVISIAGKNASNTRVFSVGIGSGASTSLVKGVARAGRGKAEFIRNTERIQPKVMSLLRCAMQPSVTNLNIVWELPSGVSAITMPQTPPSLFGGDRLILYALLQGIKEMNIANMSGKVYINGKMDKGPLNCSANFFHDESGSSKRSLPLHRLAAKAQIKVLQDKEDERENYNDNGVKTEIINLSKASNIASRHTSFVAIDKDRKERVDPGKTQCRSVPIAEFPRQMHMKCMSSAPMAFTTFCGGVGATRYKKKAGGFSMPNPLSGIKSFFNKMQTPAQSVDIDSVICSATMLGDSDDDMGFGEEVKSTFSGRPSDPMMAVISLQGFEGNWSLSNDLCGLLNVEMKKLQKSNVAQDGESLATLIVLLWLRTNFKTKHDEWDLIENKALTWLINNGIEVEGNIKQLSDIFMSDLKKK